MLRKALLAVLLFLAVCAPAQASTITVQFVGVESALVLGRTIDNGATWFNATAGLYHFRVTGGDYPTPDDIYTFCIEPLEFTDTNQRTYTIADLQLAPTLPPPMGATKAQQLEVLYGTFWTQPFTTGLNPLTAQALQIATWGIVRETTDSSYNVLAGNGRFQNTGGTALTQAQSYLDYVNGSTGPTLDVVAATRNGNQDFVVQAVPEPGTLMLLGGSLSALALLRRRRG